MLGTNALTHTTAGLQTQRGPVTEAFLKSSLPDLDYYLLPPEDYEPPLYMTIFVDESAKTVVPVKYIRLHDLLYFV